MFNVYSLKEPVAVYVAAKFFSATFPFATSLAIFASSLVAASFGIATAAKIPIITITNINSIIVNARLISSPLF